MWNRLPADLQPRLPKAPTCGTSVKSPRPSRLSSGGFFSHTPADATRRWRCHAGGWGQRRSHSGHRAYSQRERQTPNGPTENRSRQKVKLRTPGAPREGQVRRRLPDGEKELRPSGRGSRREEARGRRSPSRWRGPNGRPGEGGRRKEKGTGRSVDSETTTADPASPGAVRTGDEALAEARSDAHADRDGPSPAAHAKPGRLRRSDLSEAGGLWVACGRAATAEVHVTFRAKGAVSGPGERQVLR